MTYRLSGRLLNKGLMGAVAALLLGSIDNINNTVFVHITF